MSLLLRISCHHVPLSRSQSFKELWSENTPRISGHFSSPKMKHFTIRNCHLRPLCSISSNGDVSGLSGADSSSLVNEGSTEQNEIHRRKWITSKEIFEKLKRYGVSGILSYGLLNTAYYLTTFLFVWYYFAPAPGKMGYVAAVERFFKVMAMVWAGSQVTKLIRAGGALALAPVIDRGLSWFTAKYNFESQGKAFLAIVGFCIGLAIILFFVVTMLSA